MTGEFQLRSISGREITRWLVPDSGGVAQDATLTCDVHLEGRYHGETLAPGAPEARSESPDFRLVLKGLHLRPQDLERLAGRITEVLALPLVDRRLATFAFTCGMGELFDQSLRLTLGQRDDVRSGARPVATLDYVAGRMRGSFSYVVDAGALGDFAAGIEAVLPEAGRSG